MLSIGILLLKGFCCFHGNACLCKGILISSDWSFCLDKEFRYPVVGQEISCRHLACNLGGCGVDHVGIDGKHTENGNRPANEATSLDGTIPNTCTNPHTHVNRTAMTATSLGNTKGKVSDYVVV